MVEASVAENATRGKMAARKMRKMMAAMRATRAAPVASLTKMVAIAKDQGPREAPVDIFSTICTILSRAARRAAVTAAAAVKAEI